LRLAVAILSGLNLDNRSDAKNTWAEGIVGLAWDASIITFLIFSP